MKKILLTGASGFIGQRLLAHIKDRYDVKAVSLQATPVSALDWEGIDIVVHLAGKAHQMTPIADQEYFDVNTHLSESLAKAAKSAGVSQFIYASSIKVYGDNTATDTLSLDRPCTPNDPYGQSKWEAEKRLSALEGPEFQVAILRLPLIYGAGVKGNLWQLLKLTDSALPLPFAGIQNQRSMLYLGNLVVLIESLMEIGRGGIFLPADNPPLSTPELIGVMRKAMGRPERMFKLPDILVQILQKIRPALVARLWGSLVIESAPTYVQLNFDAPFSAQEGIQDMVNWYKNCVKIT